MSTGSPKGVVLAQLEKLFPGIRMPSARPRFSRISREIQRRGRGGGKRKSGKWGNGLETSQTDQLANYPTSQPVNQPTKTKYCPRGPATWRIPDKWKLDKLGQAKRGGAAPCLCMKINLNAGHKALPAWIPINALRAYRNRLRNEVLWLDVKLPIRCGLRIWDADGGEFDLYRSTDIAATVIRYQPQKPFKHLGFRTKGTNCFGRCLE